MTSTFPATQLKSNKNTFTFTPYLPEAGNYTVYMNTPGCKNNDNCNERTKVDIQIYYAPDVSPILFTIDQASDGDRNDIIYQGFIHATDLKNFKPHVILSVSKQAKAPTKGNVILVANYVQFIKSNSLNGLSSILTYSPSASAINASNIMSIYSNGTNNLPWKALKNRLPYNSIVKTMELVKNNDLYIGGEFLSPGDILNNQSTFQNIVKWDGKLNQLASLPYSGLNGPVSSLTHVDNDLYIGGNFTDFYMPPSLQKKVSISQNFIKYRMQLRTWVPLSGGVNGPVSSILPTGDTSLLVSGNYTGLLAQNNPQLVSNWTMSGNCWWHINKDNWIPSLEQPFITGIVYDSFSPVTSSSSGKGNDTQKLRNWVYYLGSISSAQRYASNGFVYLNNQTKPLIALDSPTVGSTSKMVVTAGAFWNDPSHNNASSIILGGQFQLPNNNDNNNNKLQNVVLYQNGQWNSILPSSNTPQEAINDLMVVSNRLFIGGQFYIQQKLNAFAIYDLVNQTFIPVPDLHTSDGSPTLINAIKYSDADNTVVVGGNFSAGGSLSCYGVCALDTKEYQWNNLGDGVIGNVTDFVFIDNKLMVAGTNLSLANGATGLAVAYDYGSNSWDTIASEDSMENGLPGPCNTVSYDNITKTTFFAGMQTNTSSAYLRMWNGQQFSLPNQELGLGSYIEQLSVIPLISNPSLSNLPLTTSNLAGNNQSVLLATGFIHLPNGNVSAALYNGSHWIPYIVASSMDGSPGFFKNVFFKSYNMSVHNTRYLPFPIVVLISIAAALGIVFVLVLGSLFVLFIKRRQEAKVGDISTMNNNNPATYYGKPPHRPESLLALLNSPNAGTGLYALKREMMEQQQSPILQDRSINGVSPPTFNNNGYTHQNDNELMVAGAGVGAAVAAGTMMEMKNISSSNQSIQKPPEAHVNHPNTAFIGSTATTTTTLNDLNTNANSRNIVTPTTAATATTAKNIRSSSHDSYNPFRQSYSSSLNLGIADQSSSPPTNEWNTNYNNNMSSNGGGGYVLGGTTANMGNIGNGATATATTGMSGVTAGALGAGAAAVAAVPFMNQQQQQQQQGQDNEIMKGGVRWTTAGLNDASFATVVPTTTTTNSIVMNQYDDRNISNNERSVNKTLNIPSMHLDHIEQLTPNTAQWTTTTTPSTYIEESSIPSSLQPQTVGLKNLNPASAVAGVTTTAAMASSLPSENHHQKDNSNNSRNIQPTTKGQNGETVKWTQLESPESHALDKAMITKPIVSTILNENNHYNTPSSIVNNTDSNVYSSSPKEYNATQQQGQPIQWTNYSTSDVKDTLQIKNVTNSMYSDYSFANYSGQDITLPGISSDFASDPDFAKWTTTTESNGDDKKNNSTLDAKVIQQQYNNSSSNNSKNDITPVPFNVTKSTTTATLSSSPSSSSSTYPSSIQQTSLPASSSSTSISSKSVKQPTYTSNLRYSSVILPDDIGPIAPSPRSSISSTVSNYQDHSIGDNNKDIQQQVKKIKEEEDKGFSFRWSDIVDSENKKDDQLETQHPLTSPQPPNTTTNNTATTATTKSNQQDKDSRWATSTTNALLSTGMEQTKSNGSGNNNNKNALDGRAASKKMVQEYFSSRENSGNTAIQPSIKTMDEKKRAKYKSDFKLAMKQALQNNQLLNSNEGCSEDRPYLYVAKFDFSAREHGELGFEKGDPIIVIDAEDDIWWMGFKDSHNDDDQGPQQGVFPSNYVERATTLPYE
ncbi:cortical protein marker for cell polarity-domain-containing protein [Cunninghamella echinulata]|nr:cortical protein marker for cell polarity-domain-containing protein [Cunninghamella echinulata]